MTIEHTIIDDPYIHEPKGASTALVKQVYQADGAGSGDWTNITPDNEVLVTVLADFPTPASSVITLVADTVYRISGAVDIEDNRIVMVDGTVLVGTDSVADSITSTTTGTLLTLGSGVSAAVKDVTINASGSTLLAQSGAGTETVVFERCTATASIIGSVSGFLETVFNRCSITAADGGLTVGGTNSRFRFTNNYVDVNTADVLDFGASTFNLVEVRNSIINNAAGVDGLDLAATSGNINSGFLGYITDNTFETSATATSGYARGDARWVVSNNVGLDDSVQAATLIADAAAVTITDTDASLGATTQTELEGYFNVAVTKINAILDILEARGFMKDS